MLNVIIFCICKINSLKPDVRIFTFTIQEINFRLAVTGSLFKEQYFSVAIAFNTGT